MRIHSRVGINTRKWKMRKLFVTEPKGGLTLYNFLVWDWATTIQSNRDRIVSVLTLHDFATILSRLNFNFRSSKNTCSFMTRTITARKLNVTIRLQKKLCFLDNKQLNFMWYLKLKNREIVSQSSTIYLTLHDSLRFSHDKIKLVKCSREWS